MDSKPRFNVTDPGQYELEAPRQFADGASSGIAIFHAGKWTIIDSQEGPVGRGEALIVLTGGPDYDAAGLFSDLRDRKTLEVVRPRPHLCDLHGRGTLAWAVEAENLHDFLAALWAEVGEDGEIEVCCDFDSEPEAELPNAPVD